MKKVMKLMSLLTVLILGMTMMPSITSRAEEDEYEYDDPVRFEYDGFDYEIDSDTEVHLMYVYSERLNDTSIEIPSIVSYEDKDYSVIGITNLSRMKKIEEVKLPNTLKYIGDSTFKQCRKLKTISIPDSVKEIEQKAFLGCTSLKSVSISNSVTTISWLTFKDCTNLSEVKLPNSLNKISPAAFYNCSNLKEITIPSSVKEIGDKSFEDTNENIIFNVEKGSYAEEFLKEEGANINIVNSSSESSVTTEDKKPSSTENKTEATTEKKPNTTEKTTEKVATENKNKKDQKIKVSKSKFKFSKSKFSKKAYSFKLKAKASGKLSYKVKNGKKYVSVSKAGKVKIKKNAKKGTYKIVITAKETNDYSKATKTVTIKIKK